ncbi:MAG: response regulator transcription factor [Pedobacter sp.]|nr:MAG: response regulator transcription factor [Pedobacter sp.]
MFKKVLVVEDHESINISVQRSLIELGINNEAKNNVYYCDDAFHRIKKAIQEGEPYELMITDLSFDADGTNQFLKSGKELIEAVRKIQPEIKVLVFSIENRLEKVKPLFNELKINAFVPKARQDSKDLKRAVQTIFNNKDYYSPNLKKSKLNSFPYDFSDYDKFLLQLMKSGKRQIDFPSHLNQRGYKPSGLSSVEKRLKAMREGLNVKTNEQLLAHVVESGII